MLRARGLSLWLGATAAVWAETTATDPGAAHGYRPIRYHNLAPPPVIPPGLAAVRFHGPPRGHAIARPDADRKTVYDEIRQAQDVPPTPDFMTATPAPSAVLPNTPQTTPVRRSKNKGLAAPRRDIGNLLNPDDAQDPEQSRSLLDWRSVLRGKRDPESEDTIEEDSSGTQRDRSRKFEDTSDWSMPESTLTRLPGVSAGWLAKPDSGFLPESRFSPVGGRSGPTMNRPGTFADPFRRESVNSGNARFGQPFSGSKLSQPSSGLPSPLPKPSPAPSSKSVFGGSPLSP